MSRLNPKIRALGVLVIGLLGVVFFIARLNHAAHSPQDSQSQANSVTVERIPSSEAKALGVDPRNH